MKLFTILFLLSFNCFAQFELKVFDLQGKFLGGGDYPTLEAAEKACADNCGVGAFGKPERLVQLDGASDEDRALAIEVIPADDVRGTPSMLRLRKTYSYTITDVTAQRQAENQLKAEMDQAESESRKGQRALVLFRVLNKRKNLTKQQKGKLLGNTSVKAIMDALNSGSIDIAADLIQAYSADGVLVTEEDKVKLLQAIQ